MKSVYSGQNMKINATDYHQLLKDGLLYGDFGSFAKTLRLNLRIWMLVSAGFKSQKTWR